jgi:carboxymethylenebutenolidase
MKAKNITVKLRDGEMGAYLAIPDRVPAGAIIAIMEIWGVNDTMRHHAHEFAQAGFICLVPDLFWRQEPGVELSDGNPEHVKKAPYPRSQEPAPTVRPAHGHEGPVGTGRGQ